MPDIENSRKTAEKGAKWVTGKQPEEQPKHPKNSQNSCFSGVSAVLPAVFRLLTATHSAPFAAVFRLFQCRAFGTSVDGRRDGNAKSFVPATSSPVRLFRATRYWYANDWYANFSSLPFQIRQTTMSNSAVTVRPASHRGAKHEIPRSALERASESAAGN